MPPRDRIAIRGVSGDSAVRFVHPQERFRSGPLKILVSAAETSSDAHGAELLKALQVLTDIEAFGIGGPKLEAAGLRVLVPAGELLAMGFTEVLGRLPRILDALKILSAAAAAERPDLAIVIDYPDFHFRLAKRLKRLGIPVIYYIPPKTWVWRRKRNRILREWFDRVLCIFPFEEEFYRQDRVAAKYVGNPLLDELPLEMTRKEARAKLELAPSEKVLVLMPGSRPSELRRHVPLLLESVQRAAALLRSSGFLGKNEELKVLVPIPETSAQMADETEARANSWLEMARPGGMRVRFSRGNAAVCLLAADCGVIKSGTSTLEAAILGCAHVVIYRPNFITGFVFRRVIRYSGPVGLVNLAAGRLTKPYLSPELLSGDATTRNIADEIVRLFTDTAYREKMREGMRALRESLVADPAHRQPSRSAAAEIFEFYRVREGS